MRSRRVVAITLMGAVLALGIGGTVAAANAAVSNSSASSQAAGSTLAKPPPLPSHEQLRKATVTAENEAVFWSGGIKKEAETYAHQHNKKTLEMLLDHAKITMPVYKPGDEVAEDLWNYASLSLAEQASGLATMVVNENMREGNGWEGVEFPAIRSKGGKVQKVTVVHMIKNHLSAPEDLWVRGQSKCGAAGPRSVSLVCVNALPDGTGYRASAVLGSDLQSKDLRFLFHCDNQGQQNGSTFKVTTPLWARSHIFKIAGKKSCLTILESATDKRAWFSPVA
jgi:hypothetical protein